MSNPDDSQFVTRALCDERFMRIIDKLSTMDRRLEKIEQAMEQSRVRWIHFFLAILSGAIVSLITWLLHLVR
jgi:hypothetical protein